MTAAQSAADYAWVAKFARRRDLSDAGLGDDFDAALAGDDFDRAAAIAAKVGHSLDRSEMPASGGAARAGFTFTSVADSLRAGVKPIQWLVRNYIEADSLALMFGDPGCGKSFAAIDLACCIATGTPWHGNRTYPGPVFYIAGEGQNGLMRRFAAWSQHNGVDLTGAPVFVGHRPAQLVSAASAAEVANAVEAMRAESGREPALIVVDTLARNFGPGDENTSTDMGNFVSNLDAFLRKSGEWNATVLVVHHSGKADKFSGRGSSALKAAVDSEYMLTKDEHRIVRMEATKMKDAEHPEPIAFRLDGFTLPGLFDDEGEPVTSAVLCGVAHVPPAKAGKPGRGKNQTRALTLLHDLLDENRRRVEKSGRDPELARVTMDEWKARMANDGMNRFQVRDVVDGLRDRQVIVLDLGGYVRIGGEA